MKKNENIKQWAKGVQEVGWRVQIVRNPSPAHIASSLSLRQQPNARLCSIFVSPAFVLKNKNLQHESYRAWSYDSNHIKNNEMGHGGVNNKPRGANSKPNQGPAQIPSSLSSRNTKHACFLFKLLTPALVLKNKNLQHESYRAWSHDSNHVKNLI